MMSGYLATTLIVMRLTELLFREAFTRMNS